MGTGQIVREKRNWLLRAIGLATAVALIGLPAMAQQETADPRASELARPESQSPVAWARDRVFPSVVSIVVVKEAHQGGRRRLTRAGGSGTIISKDGHIVTNAHVTQDATKFKLILSDKREVQAELIGEDPLSDIAVIKFDPAELASGEEFRVASFGNSNELEIGDAVLAMGAPWGMSHSMSLGVVNNDKRLLANFFQDDADYESALGRDQPTGSFYRWIQHDAAIAPGNSGGPLVSLKGEIIGVNTRGMPFAGDMGFASPSSVVQDVVAQLIAHGEVIRSFIGLRFKPIKDTDHTCGVLINSVVEDSPADEAGLRPGDLLVTINGEPKTVNYTEQMPEFRRYLSDLPVGTKLTIGCQRDGEKRVTTLVTQKYEKDVGERAAIKTWGLTVQGITPRMARNRRLNDAKGVLVTGVDLGGPAAEAKPPLRKEDVIRAVNGRMIADLPAFKDAREKSAAAGEADKTVLVEFERESGRYLAVLKPAEEEEEARPAELAKAWLPIEVQALVGPLAEQLGLDQARGFRIVRIYENAPADPSGLEVGDVITAVNGSATSPKSPRDTNMFWSRIKRLSVGDEAELALLRDGTERTARVTLLPTPKQPGEARRVKDRDFDFEVRDITFFDIARKRWKPDTTGVLVIEVEIGGWAGVGHLRKGDLILRIDDRIVEDTSQFKAALAAVKEQRPEKVRMLVMRGIETRFLFIDADWE